MNKRKTGQSTIEYIVLIAAILSLILVFMSRGGLFDQGLSNAYNELQNGMVDRANLLSGFYNSI